MKITVYDDEDNEVKMPMRKEVCDRCHGEGAHVNPAIDGHGITSDEMEELGDDFREDYLSGRYDVRCEECDGLRVVDVLDRERCTPEQLKAWDEAEQAEYDYRAERAAELRAGC